MLSALIRSEHSYPALPLARQLEHQRFVRPNPLVLRSTLLNHPTPTADRDRPGSRRSEPSSRTALIGEQPNPWDLLQPQDAMSRHRGAKPPRRYGLLGEISLLSPEYLLSDERRPFHTESAGSLGPAFASARPICLAVKHPYTLTLYARLPTALRAAFGLLRYFFGGDRPSQTAHLALSLARIHGTRLESQQCKSGISPMTPRWPERQRFKVSHLSYACKTKAQYQATVKVHGVFPSCCGNVVSSPRLQFRRVHR